jgi:hypothetical protein
MKKLALIVTILISLGTQSAIAQTADLEDEQFDNAIQQFILDSLDKLGLFKVMS